MTEQQRIDLLTPDDELDSDELVESEVEEIPDTEFLALQKEVIPRGRLSDVSRTVRTSLLTSVITEQMIGAKSTLKLTEEGRYADFHLLDLKGLAYCIIDFIAEKTEFTRGISKADVIKAIMPIAIEQVQAKGLWSSLDEERISFGVETVFDALANRSKRYHPFCEEYWDGEKAVFTTRKFWLIKAVYSDDSQQTDEQCLFELTPEAYQAYFGVMEAEGLDLARIGALRMEMLVTRGALDEALTVADGNTRQTRRLISEIHTLKRQIVRQISRVDIERVEFLGSEAVNQADALFKDLKLLGNLVRNHLNQAKEEKQKHQLALLNEKLDDQRSVVVELTRELNALPRTFREHRHKLFRSREMRAGRGLPPLEKAMAALSRLKLSEADKLAADFIARLSKPVAVDLFDPGTMSVQLDRALEKLTAHGENAEIEENAIELPQEYESRLTPELVRHVKAWVLKQLTSDEIKLSTILEKADKELDADAAVAVQAMAILTFVNPAYRKSYGFHSRLDEQKRRFNLRLSDGRRPHGHELFLSITRSSNERGGDDE